MGKVGKAAARGRSRWGSWIWRKAFALVTGNLLNTRAWCSVLELELLLVMKEVWRSGVRLRNICTPVRQGKARASELPKFIYARELACQVRKFHTPHARPNKKPGNSVQNFKLWDSPALLWTQQRPGLLCCISNCCFKTSKYKFTGSWRHEDIFFISKLLI
jgi:hypothetical protein